MISSLNSGENKKLVWKGTDVYLSLIKGAPLFWVKDFPPWTSISLPRFPVALSLISGCFLMVPVLIKAYQAANINITPFNFATTLIGAFLSGVSMGVSFNLTILVLSWAILKRFKKGDASDIHHKSMKGAQRITYFAAIFQVPFWASIAGVSLTVKYKEPAGWIAITFASAIIAFGVIRLLAVFQGVRRDTDGRIIPGLFAMLSCIDVWLWLLMC